MADRYRLAVPRQDKNGKTWWTKIGVMWPRRDKDGFSITLEVLPLQTINDQGQVECRVMVFDDTQDNNQQQQQPSSNDSSSDDLDDEIPF
jgi:hypothetical protein|tara:strand:+ start:92 stop:361 length:270 start_codon:yes stop_codon:yes gene_type:complete